MPKLPFQAAAEGLPISSQRAERDNGEPFLIPVDPTKPVLAGGAAQPREDARAV